MKLYISYEVIQGNKIILIKVSGYLHIKNLWQASNSQWRQTNPVTLVTFILCYFFMDLSNENTLILEL